MIRGRWRTSGAVAVGIEEHFKHAAGLISLAIEAAAVLVVAFGAAQAFARVLALMFNAEPELRIGKDIWLRFATWILLSLEFALAADIVRTAISPSWTDIGQLAAIAAIRTALNYFLSKDIEALAERGDPDARPQPPR